jgi:glutamate synthase domain-containing protein 2
MKIKLHDINISNIKEKNVIVNDLTIKDNHSYCVGENKMIVHNCLTTQQTGIGYPTASLIKECNEIKKTIKGDAPLIVADGGMKEYSDIIKALGLGADYVMIGSIFNTSLESSGKNYLFGINIFSKLAKLLYSWGFPVKKKFYGMSTKTAQKKWGNEKIRTSEGVVRYRKVKYRLDEWVNNFDHYLRTAMSYTNARSIYEFIGNVNFNLISNNAKNRFKK